MVVASVQEADGTILGVIGVIILICVIVGVAKKGWKALIFLLILGLVAYLYISDAVLSK